MQHRFVEAPAMKSGAIFLGLGDDNAPRGITTPRHLITVAGAQSGKSSGLVVPNLQGWFAGSVLVIDVKGELAAASWREREAMGHAVHVIDPFKTADVPDRLRKAFNPLAAIDQFGMTAREDLRVIADGLIMRSNPRDAMWDEGSVTVLSGFLAHCISTAPEHLRTLPAVRAMLRQTDEQLADVFADMAESEGVGGLAQAAGAVGLSEARSSREFIKGARDQTQWLDSEPMLGALGHSDFDLADLKNGMTAVYLVLPPQYLQEHGRFLRLFVRCAINAMAKGGNRKGGRCLFVLDEFFSLGYIAEIATAAGLMPAYGVHLWPILQDLGQLEKLYEKEGAATFFGNADAHIFFGNTDPLTVGHISERLGKYGADELTVSRAFPVASPTPTHRPHATDPHLAAVFNINAYEMDLQKWEWQRDDQLRAHLENEAYETQARKVGQLRYPPDVVKEMVAKHEGDKLARSMVVFGTGGNVYRLKPWPYFLPRPTYSTPAQIKARAAIAEREAAAKAAAKAWENTLAKARDDDRRQHETAASWFFDGMWLCVAVVIFTRLFGWALWLHYPAAFLGGLLLAAGVIAKIGAHNLKPTG